MRASSRALHLAVALAAVAGWPRIGQPNGRAPSSVSAAVSPDGETILVGTTFGAVLSRDGGCSFRWLCEQSIGFGGTFDPKYAIGADGTIYATTFEGLRVSRDGGCTFRTATAEVGATDPGALDGIWIDAIELAPSGDVWVATAESGRANDLYRSTDGARTFAPMGLRSGAIWWKSVRVAPSAPARVYAAGYQVAAPDPPMAHLRRSDDGGATWRPMPLAQLQLATAPIVHVMAVDANAADTLYVRALGAAPPLGDRLYRSADGGTSFTQVLVTTEPITAVVARGALVWAAAGAAGLYESRDGGASFSAVEGAPQLACLVARGDGQLVGCGTNWDPDFFALGVSADARKWTKVMRFAELAGPLTCADGTPQRETCELSQWPSVREQLGVTGTTASCPAPEEPPKRGSAGCCDGGGSAGGLGVLLVAMALARRRVRTAG